MAFLLGLLLFWNKRKSGFSFGKLEKKARKEVTFHPKNKQIQDISKCWKEAYERVAFLKEENKPKPWLRKENE